MKGCKKKMGHGLSSGSIKVSFHTTMHCRSCHMMSTRSSILNVPLASSPVYISSLMKILLCFWKCSTSAQLINEVPSIHLVWLSMSLCRLERVRKYHSFFYILLWPNHWVNKNKKKLIY